MMIAALWGLAEGTLFFIVPDVWLSLIAVRRGLTPALTACGFALAGALVGGAMMYAWGAADPASARDMLDWVPAIGPKTIRGVRAALHDDGVSAILLGSFTGVPYKIFAVEASAAGIGPAAFLSISVPARLIRFALVSVVAWGISRLLERRLNRLIRTLILLGVWTVFYAAYLSLMPN